MAEAEQRMQNEAAEAEQRRLAEEAALAEQRRLQRMELILEIAYLEREREEYKQAQEENLLIGTADLNSRLNSRINDWADLLESDQDGNPVYSPRGMPEYR